MDVQISQLVEIHNLTVDQELDVENGISCDYYYVIKGMVQMNFIPKSTAKINKNTNKKESGVHFEPTKFINLKRDNYFDVLKKEQDEF